MCTEKEVKITQSQLDLILNSCNTVVSLMKDQGKIEQQNEFLQKQIDDEVKERKEEIKDIQKENGDRFQRIDNKFEILFTQINKVNAKIDKKIDTIVLPKILAIKNWIIAGLSGILGSILVSVIIFFIGKILNWF